jgi:hypothetical protein
MTKRLEQALLIGSFLPLCWLTMMAVHELGHVVGAAATGRTVQRVVLHPLAVSRTDVSPNPAPLLVVWAGPIVGVALPLAAWAILDFTKASLVYLLRWFAGFCLVANGCYVGVGSFGQIGDAGEMLRCGSPAWSLWGFGIVAVPLGLYLWNGLGPHFGLGEEAGKVDRRATIVSCGLLLAAVVLAASLSPCR